MQVGHFSLLRACITISHGCDRPPCQPGPERRLGRFRPGAEAGRTAASHGAPARAGCRGPGTHERGTPTLTVREFAGRQPPGPTRGCSQDILLGSNPGPSAVIAGTFLLIN